MIWVIVLFHKQNFSRAKPADVDSGLKERERSKEKAKDLLPTLDALLEKRDYTGAITLLRFQRSSGKIEPHTGQWLAYAAFHNGDFQTARKVTFILHIQSPL